MNIWTTELTDGITVVDSVAALTGGSASTTLSTAVSSGTTLEVGSIAGFTPGCTIIIDDGGANEEHILVRLLTVSAPDIITTFNSVTISHSIGESVDIVSAILGGQDRTHLVNGHLDQAYELDSVQEMFAYLIDSNVTNKVDGWAAVLKNFRSQPWVGTTMELWHGAAQSASGSLMTEQQSQSILATEWGDGYAVALQELTSPSTKEFQLCGFEGTAGFAAAQVAQIYLLNKHTLSHAWEIVGQERLPHGASIIESRSKKTFVISHTNNARRDFVKQWKALRQSDVDIIREVERLSDGPRRPFIADFAGTEVVSNLLLLRFANENALTIIPRDFDQYDVTAQLQTIKQEDDR